MIRFLLAGLTFALCFSSPCFAQTLYEPDRLLPTVSLDQMRTIAESAGYSTEPLDGERNMMMVSHPERHDFLIQLTSCDKSPEARCMGVTFMAVAGTLPLEDVSVLNEMNLRSGPVKVILPEGGNLVMMSGHIMVSSGMTMQNIRRSIAMYVTGFEEMTRLFEILTTEE